MVTERKGCGLVHAVNGGFSWACGYCARANERIPTITVDTRTGETVAYDGVPVKQLSYSAATFIAQRDWVDTQLGDVEHVITGCFDNEGLPKLDPATVGDVGQWPPLHVVEQGPLERQGGWITPGPF